MSTLKKLKQKLSRGSILVFTLLIMFILLISALGIASVTVIERKTSGTTGKSIQSFQVADSGAEIVLQKIYKDNLRTVGELAGVLGNCNDNDETLAVISGSIATGKDFKITFEDNSGNDITSCTDSATQISRIKSVGSYAQTSRAIEVAVAQTGSCEWFDAGSDDLSICGSSGDRYCGTSASSTYRVKSTADKMCDILNTGSWASTYVRQGIGSPDQPISGWELEPSTTNATWQWDDQTLDDAITGLYCCGISP